MENELRERNVSFLPVYRTVDLSGTLKDNDVESKSRRAVNFVKNGMSWVMYVYICSSVVLGLLWLLYACLTLDTHKKRAECELPPPPMIHRDFFQRPFLTAVGQPIKWYYHIMQCTMLSVLDISF